MSEAAGASERFAWGSLAVAGGVFAILMAFAGRYGYHRDELYFLEAGRHLAWGYPDQPPFVPLVARLMNDLAPGSVTVLRVPSAIVAAAIVPVTAVISRQFGGERRAQLLAAGSAGVSLIELGAGHTLNTTTFQSARLGVDLAVGGRDPRRRGRARVACRRPSCRLRPA